LEETSKSKTTKFLKLSVGTSIYQVSYDATF